MEDRENSDSWIHRIVLVAGLVILATGLAAASEGRFGLPVVQAVAFSIALGGALAWGLSHRWERERAVAAGVAFGVGVLGFAYILNVGSSFGITIGLVAPVLIVTAAILGPVAALVLADGVLLLWALALGLSAGGFLGLETDLGSRPESALLGLAAGGALLNGIALACGWWMSQGSPEAQNQIERLRQEQTQLSSELDATQALATVGRLVANVAHEISNPIQAIDNMLFVMLGQTPEEDSHRRFLVMMKQGVERIAQYIDQLSDFYRPTADSGSADMNRVVEDVFRFLERQLENSNIKVKQELDPNLPPAGIAEEKLRQVVLNIVLNAAEVMPDGGEIAISTTRQGNMLVTAIQDTGPGIPAANLEDIFQPFFTTKEDRGGTGLGLSISQRILRTHGGEITAETTPTGARLIVRAPTARSGPQ